MLEHRSAVVDGGLCNTLSARLRRRRRRRRGNGTYEGVCDGLHRSKDVYDGGDVGGVRDDGVHGGSVAAGVGRPEVAGRTRLTYEWVRGRDGARWWWLEEERGCVLVRRMQAFIVELSDSGLCNQSSFRRNESARIREGKNEKKRDGILTDEEEGSTRWLCMNVYVRLCVLIGSGSGYAGLRLLLYNHVSVSD